MELLDRYLQAVSFWLPRNKKHDIIAELSEDLLSQIEDKEAALGHPLNQDEQVELIKRCGPPMMVAGSYLPQQQFMPPVMFLIYRFVIKIVLLWVLVPLFVIVSAGPFIAAQNHPLALIATAVFYFQAAVFSVGMITIVFGFIAKFKPGMGQERWDPRKLPRIRTPRDPQHISALPLKWPGISCSSCGGSISSAFRLVMVRRATWYASSCFRFGITSFGRSSPYRWLLSSLRRSTSHGHGGPGCEQVSV